MGILISHSDIKAFLTCRRKWYWSYVNDFRKPEKKSGPLALGTRVHSSLESFYDGSGDPIAVHDELARADVDYLETSDAPPWELDQLYKDMVTGRNCIAAHQNWLADTGADADFKVIGVEGSIEAPILGGAITLRGKVDVLFEEISTGFLVVNDLKTAAKKTVREELERSWQHHVYMAVLRILHPEMHVGAAYYTVMYKGARTDPVERFRVPGTTRMADTKLKQLEIIGAEMLRTMNDIEDKGIAYAYPTPAEACRWCEFRHPCEVVDESPIAARELLDKEFSRGGRHKRYDKV